MVTIKIKNIIDAESWCIKHIGVRLYFIHTKFGGREWEIRKNNGHHTLTIHDEKKALLAILKFGDQL